MFNSIDMNILKLQQKFDASMVTDHGTYSTDCDEYPPGHPFRYLHIIDCDDAKNIFALKLFDNYYVVDPSEITRYWIAPNEYDADVQAWIQYIYNKKAGIYLHPEFGIFFQHPPVRVAEEKAYIATDKVSDAYLDKQRYIAQLYNDEKMYQLKFAPFATVENSLAATVVQKFFPAHKPSIAHSSAAPTPVHQEK